MATMTEEKIILFNYRVMAEEIWYDEDWNEIPIPLEERKKHLEEQEKS